MKRRMKIGTIDGAIKKLFHPSHTDIEVSTPDEISQPIIQDLLARITQTRDQTTGVAKPAEGFLIQGVKVNARSDASDSKSAVRKGAVRVDAAGYTGKAKGAEVNIQDQEEIDAAVADVRADGSATDWMLAGVRVEF